jgi:hypothetical protein
MKLKMVINIGSCRICGRIVLIEDYTLYDCKWDNQI